MRTRIKVEVNWISISQVTTIKKSLKSTYFDGFNFQQHDFLVNLQQFSSVFDNDIFSEHFSMLLTIFMYSSTSPTIDDYAKFICEWMICL